jgi:hypothetical protein
MDKKLSSVLFSTTRQKRERKVKNNVVKIQKRLSAYIFALYVVRLVVEEVIVIFFSLRSRYAKVQKREKKKEVIAKGDVDLSVYTFE